MDNTQNAEILSYFSKKLSQVEEKQDQINQKLDQILKLTKEDFSDTAVHHRKFSQIMERAEKILESLKPS